MIGPLVGPVPLVSPASAVDLGPPVVPGPLVLLDPLAGRAVYVVAALLMGIGLYVVVADANLLRKVLGLNLFQTGIFLVYVAAAVRAGGRSPLVTGPGRGPYVDPLPHVLILTAIVVGVSVTAVAAALVVRIHDERGTLRTDELGRDAGGERE